MISPNPSLYIIVHNQMLQLQSQPISEGSQPLYEDKICETVLGKRLGYSKGHGWGPKPKSRKSYASSSCSSYYHHALIVEVSKLRDNLANANRMIEEQRLSVEERDRLVANLDRQIVDRDRQMDETVRRMQENYAREMEHMRKMIENMSQQHRGP